MESRVFWLFVICYVTCILRKNALGESTSAKVFMSINNAFQPDVEMLKTENVRTVQSIETETRLDGGITVKRENDWSKFEIPLESPKDLSETKISNDFLKANCPRYCIEQVETGKNDSVVEDINFFLSFAKNESEENENLNVAILHDRDFLDNSPNMKITRHIPIYNRNVTIVLDNCEKKKLVHGVNLSEYTETNFHIDANVTEIVINILGNLTHAVLTISKINTGKDFNKIEDTQSKATTTSNKSKKFNNLRKDAHENIDNNRINTYAIPLVNSKINGRPNEREFARLFKRSTEIMDEKETNNDDETMTNDFSDVLLPSVASTVAKNMIKYPIFSLRNNSLTRASYGDFRIPQNASKNSKAFNGKIFALDQQKIQPRSSEIASLNEDIDTNDMKLSTRDNVMQDNDQDFAAQFAQNIGDSSLERRKIMLDINVKSNLIAAPGTTHRVLFDVTNNCVLPVRYAIRARSSPFRIIGVQPIYLWLYPGQTNYVAVDIVVPLDIPDATVNTLTLSIDGTEIPEKTVYIYVQKYAISKIKIDNIKPTLEYSFNSNCAGKLDKDRCEKTFWSADIIVQDYDSGLKRVLSTPNGLYLNTKFISGTKDRVTFFYLSNCCSTIATITAIDISENQYVRTVDVRAWDNLSQGEIAAIVLGALLLLFLIIFLIIAIVYCVRKRSSHDLPYTQRYGSRPPARSERTSF